MKLKTDIMSKWFYKPQKEIKQRLESLGEYRFLDQTVTKDRVYEKYMILGNDVRVILFEIVKTDWGVGYTIHEYNAIS